MLRNVAVGLCLLALLGGCSSAGPATVTRDRFDYVASVINAFTLEGTVSLAAQSARPDRGDAFTSLGGTGRYADQPTITYAPLAGEKFARSIMTPIPVAAILPHTLEHDLMFPPPIQVRHAREQPDDAFVAVRYRERWFWIEDRDHASKAALNFVMLMFSMRKPGPARPRRWSRFPRARELGRAPICREPWR